jgi:hypothetical protein
VHNALLNYSYLIQCNLPINKISIVKASHVLCESLFTYTAIPKPENSSWYQSPKLLIFIFKREMASSSTSFSLSAANLHNLITIVSVKLKASNYLIWRMQILPLIQSLQLMNHLTDDAPDSMILKESGELIQTQRFKNGAILTCCYEAGSQAHFQKKLLVMWLG